MTKSVQVNLGYLFFDEIPERISKGEINPYDIVFTRDTRSTYIISEDLEIIEFKSRVYVFNSVNEANEKLNQSSDTYVGQVVSILDGNVYRGYIVNQLEDGTYTTTPLWENSETIDYNTLGNRPIINMIGTLDEPVMIADLDNGIYSIKGRYKITEPSITTYLNPNYNLFLIEKTDNQTMIKKISSEEIIDYVVINNEVVTTNRIVTEDFLNEKGYASTAYVDEKIATLDIINREEIESYITTILEEQLETILDSKIDERIDKKIIGANEEQIIALFATNTK